MYVVKKANKENRLMFICRGFDSWHFLFMEVQRRGFCSSIYLFNYLFWKSWTFPLCNRYIKTKINHLWSFIGNYILATRFWENMIICFYIAVMLYFKKFSKWCLSRDRLQYSFSPLILRISKICGWTLLLSK